MKFIAPNTDTLNGMLNMIAGDDAVAKESSVDDSTEVRFTGLYVDDDGNPVASCGCDLKTAAALGCALSMIPPGGAESMVKDNELSDMANSNLYEVMNILSSLFMNDKTPHLLLKQVDETSSIELESGEIHSVAYELDLGRYGPGALVFHSV